MAPPSTDWLDRVRDLYPTDGIIIVGAGTGADAIMYAGTDCADVVLIEANEINAGKLSDTARGRNGWSIHSAVIFDESREVDFHIASNPGESSVLSPITLVPLWRNLTTRQRDRRNATTLGQLIVSSASRSRNFNWIVVDCLPSLPILHGADGLLLDSDVVILRVVLHEHLIPKLGASKVECDLFLSDHGYRCVGVRLERQPMIGKAIYIRDWKAIAKRGWDNLRSRERETIHAGLQREQVEKDFKVQRHHASSLAAQLDAVTTEFRSFQQRAATLERAAGDFDGKLAAALASLEEKRVENVKLRSEQAQRQESLTRVENELKVAIDSTSDWQERAHQAAAASSKVGQDLKEQQRQTNHWSQEVSSTQSINAALTQSVSELKTENRELQQAVRLTNKLQILSQADLSELRGRHEMALQAQEHQQSLLAALESKLHIAARYFRRLQNAPGSPDNTLIVDPPTIDTERTRGRRTGSAKKDAET
jgi:chromosome segregation ATPase